MMEIWVVGCTPRRGSPWEWVFVGAYSTEDEAWRWVEGDEDRFLFRWAVGRPMTLEFPVDLPGVRWGAVRGRSGPGDDATGPGRATTMRLWAGIARDNAKAMLPFQSRLRAAWRSRRPYRSDPGLDAIALSDGTEILAAIRRSGAEIAGATVLEIGTGWMPTIPALVRLAGAARVIGTDLERLMDAKTYRHALALASAGPDRAAGASALDGDWLDYRCPFDPASVPDGSVDVVYSRAVLEHVRPGAIASIHRDSLRMLRPGGVAVHVVDNSDHFHYRERRLSRVEFLRRGDLAWRVMCLHTQNYQNRLRHSDHASLLASAGFDVVEAAGTPDPGSLADLARMRLAPRFAGRPHDDLATLRSFFVARKAPPSAPAAPG